MLRCQFLCHVLKAIFFITIALKLSYFCKKMQNFRAPGAPPSNPRASAGWRLCPQTSSLRQRGVRPQTSIGLRAPPSDPQNSPQSEFLATRLDQRWNRSGFSRPDPTGNFQKHCQLTGQSTGRSTGF